MPLKLIDQNDSIDSMASSGQREHFQTVVEIPVSVLTAASHRFTSAVFVRMVSQFGPGPELLLERLNDQNLRFMAFKFKHGVDLYNLESIALIECKGTAPEVVQMCDDGCHRERVEICLVNDETIRNDVLFTLPQAKCRVSDLLNSPDNRFLVLFDGTATSYVNRSCIQYVRNLRS